MSRPRKTKVEIDNKDSLSSLLQETYNDACGQIVQAQNIMNEVTNTVKPETINDSTAIAKAKTDALKIKENSIKIKLDVAKLQAEIIKNNGDVKKAAKDMGVETASDDDFKTVREMMNKIKKDNDPNSIKD